MELFCEQFGLPIVNDLVKLALGKKLGAGVYRTVYECPRDATAVLKINNQDITSNFANAKEWEIWQHVADTKFAKWLAPCVDISDRGLVLVQRKTEPVTLAQLQKELPRVPVWFSDRKVQNWGRLNGKIVCHDYGNHLLFDHGLTDRTRKADWWE